MLRHMHSYQSPDNTGRSINSIYTVATNGSRNFQHGEVQESWENNNYQAAIKKKSKEVGITGYHPPMDQNFSLKMPA